MFLFFDTIFVADISGLTPRVTSTRRIGYRGPGQRPWIPNYRDSSSRIHDRRKRAGQPFQLQCFTRWWQYGRGWGLSLAHERPHYHHYNLKGHAFPLEPNDSWGDWAGHVPWTGFLVFHLLLWVKYKSWGNVSCIPIQHNCGRVHGSKQCWQVSLHSDRTQCLYFVIGILSF